MIKRIGVKVPASSGNLGPGFDVLGMALDLWNELYIEVLNPKPGLPVFAIRGEGQEKLPRNSTNIIYQCVKWVFSKAEKKVPQLGIVCLNRIPLARGLGSSSAAILSGLLAGNRLLGNRFSRNEILNWATEWEGHPDNVAASLLGGVQASTVIGNKVLSVAWPIPKTNLIVAIPDFELSTKKARGVLPKKIPLADAIQNLSSVALLSEAFERHPEWLKDLLNDRWHEPYRAKLVKGFNQVKKAALAAKAWGVTLSGAGPTILSFVSPRNQASVGRAMKKAFEKVGVDPQILNLKVARKGATVQ